MLFPDPNVGYVFWYSSRVTDEGIEVSFLKGLVKIVFRYENIAPARVATYDGGRIFWDVIRWGKAQRVQERWK